MEQIYCENIQKITKNKKIIEKTFNIKLSHKGKLLFIEGESENTFFVLGFIEAVNLGFTVPKAITLEEEGVIFKKINLKDIKKRTNIRDVRSRVIGTNGRALRNIEDLSNCSIVLHDNIIGIIGLFEDVSIAERALIKLINGSNHSKVYSFLEREKSKGDLFY